MIADGSPQAALEERLVEAIEAASTSVALEGTLHGLTQPDVAEELGLSRVRQLQRWAEGALRAETPANLALAAGG
jgi:hypothetical protein